MKPMGRARYNDKTGGKHHIRLFGKFRAWWLDVIEPNKNRERLLVRKEIQEQINDR